MHTPTNLSTLEHKKNCVDSNEFLCMCVSERESPRVPNLKGMRVLTRIWVWERESVCVCVCMSELVCLRAVHYTTQHNNMYVIYLCIYTYTYDRHLYYIHEYTPYISYSIRVSKQYKCNIIVSVQQNACSVIVCVYIRACSARSITLYNTTICTRSVCVRICVCYLNHFVNTYVDHTYVDHTYVRMSYIHHTYSLCTSQRAL